MIKLKSTKVIFNFFKRQHNRAHILCIKYFLYNKNYIFYENLLIFNKLLSNSLYKILCSWSITYFYHKRSNKERNENGEIDSKNNVQISNRFFLNFEIIMLGLIGYLLDI